jgi:hypothetical protein
MKGEFSETDFIIADPNRPSVLIIEVKGGQMKQRNGRWYQNNIPLKTPPLDQAFIFRRQLIERFRENKVESPTIGVVVCFPDTFFSQQPTQDDLKGLVIGGQDLPYLEKILPQIMERAVPEPWQVKGPWISLIHRLWGETWVPDLCLCSRVQIDRDKRIMLDRDQVCRLEEIEENHRILVTGGAGTGKTILAREAALRLAEKGSRVLLLCFTDALGQWLSNTISHEDISAAAIRRFASELLGEGTAQPPVIGPSEYWNSVSLRAAVDGLPSEKDRWDCVIVDEGQDFSDEDWELARECAGGEGRLWIFADDAQAFWADRAIADDIQKTCFKVRLKRPYRCPDSIQNLSESYAQGCDPDPNLLRQGINDKIIRIISSSEQRLAKQVGKEINRLLSEGLKPQDIAVISVRGRGTKDAIIHQKELGGNRVFPATDPDADSQIVCETFLRFKGLERPAVIITDLRLVSDSYETRMHIAVSRATSLLRIVGVEKEMRKDRRLAELI